MYNYCSGTLEGYWNIGCKRVACIIEHNHKKPFCAELQITCTYTKRVIHNRRLTPKYQYYYINYF